MRDVDRAELAELTHNDAPLYAADEVGHMDDVRGLVRRVTWLAILGAVLVAAGLLGLWPGPEGRRRAWAAVGRGGWLAVGLVGAVGVSVVVAWPLFFTGFHELFFQPGTWQFTADSGLIRLFPERFWKDVTVLLALLTAGEGLLLAVALALLGKVASPGKRGQGLGRA